MKKRKICNVIGCNNPAWSKGLCLYHCRMSYKPIKRTFLKKSAIPLKKDNRIAERTIKRLYQEEILYKQVKEIRKEELVSQNRWICLFCGKELPQRPIWHHTRGRDGDLLFQGRFLYPAHFKCHISQYHQLPINKIPWWSDYIERIKMWDPELYKKELIKMDKANEN